MSDDVTIGFVGGDERFNKTGLDSPKIRGLLMDVEKSNERINTDLLEKGFYNSTVQFSLRNTGGYLDNKFLGDESIETRHKGTLTFTGSFADILESHPDIVRVAGDTKELGFNDDVNLKLKESDYSGIPTANKGKYSNIICGEVSDEAAATPVGKIKARRVAPNVFHVNWAHIKSIDGAYEPDGTPLAGEALDNNGDGSAYCNVTCSEDYIRVNVHGMKDGGGDMIEDPAEQLDAINDAFGSFTIASADITAATAIYAVRNYTGAVIVIDDKLLWKDFLAEFSRNWDCVTFPKNDGSVGLKVLAWSAEVAAGKLLVGNVDYPSFKYKMDWKKLTDEFRRFYDYNPIEKTWNESPSDLSTLTDYKSTSRDLKLKYHTDAATSKDVGARLLFFKKKPPYWYRFKIGKEFGDSYGPGTVADVQVPVGVNKGTRLCWIFQKSLMKGGGSAETEFFVLDVTDVKTGGITVEIALDPDAWTVNNLGDNDKVLL